MKGYIHVCDSREQYLKSLFKNDGDDIVEETSNLDFAYVKDEHVQSQYVFSLHEDTSYIINNDHRFRHFNNILTTLSFMIVFHQYNIKTKNILILGYGDLAKCLIKVLKQNHELTIANRNEKELESILKEHKHLDISLLTGHYDVVINTIPRDDLDFSNVTYRVFFDLASHYKGIHIVSLRNLPAKYFPEESAYCMYLYMKKMMTNE